MSRGAEIRETDHVAAEVGAADEPRSTKSRSVRTLVERLRALWRPFRAATTAIEPTPSKERRERMAKGLDRQAMRLERVIEALIDETNAREAHRGTPVAKGAENPGADRAPDSQPASPRRVLLVDDYRPSITSLSELLAQESHVVAVATGRRQALEVVETFAPEFVLCDLGLPNMGGTELAHRLAKRPDRPHLIAVSGLIDPASTQTALSAGFEQVLAKPVEIEKVIDLLASLPAASSTSRRRAPS